MLLSHLAIPDSHGSRRRWLARVVEVSNMLGLLFSTRADPRSTRFIKDHFADAFRLLPDASPPRMGAREEKWISSTTLAQAGETILPMAPPKTPEPKSPYLPSFALSTPNGTSPQSLKTSPSPGSPLHALQFIRRADVEGLSYRPETPTRSTRSGTSSVLNTPSRHHPQPAWRP